MTKLETLEDLKIAARDYIKDDLEHGLAIKLIEMAYHMGNLHCAEKAIALMHKND